MSTSAELADTLVKLGQLVEQLNADARTTLHELIADRAALVQRDSEVEAQSRIIAMQRDRNAAAEDEIERLHGQLEASDALYREAVTENDRLRHEVKALRATLQLQHDNEGASQ